MSFDCARFSDDFTKEYCSKEEPQQAVCTRCSVVYPFTEFSRSIVDYPCTFLATADTSLSPSFCGGKVIVRDFADRKEEEQLKAKEYSGPLDAAVERSRALRKKRTMQTRGLHIYCSKCDMQYGHDHELPANFLEIPCPAVDFKLTSDKRVPCGGKWVAVPHAKS